MKKNRILRIGSIVLVLLFAGICALADVMGLNYQILVNQTHPIPADYAAQLDLRDVETVEGYTYQAEATALEAYYALHDALLEKGVEIGVDSAYRSVERQQEIMDEFVEEYGEEYAREFVAQPGTSEHHTGLVLDIVPKVDGVWVIENEDMLKLPEIFAVIHAALPDYGFILRYPEGKEDITGYSYEPWHLRYVGKELARELYDRGITLEEYYAEIQ